MPNTEWRTKDGKILKFEEMSDMHIINCIKALKRNDPKSPYLRALRSELQQRYPIEKIIELILRLLKQGEM